MFKLKVKDHIAASHILVGYEGPCSKLHGHTWQVEATVGGNQLDQVGLLADFKTLKGKLKDVLMPLDHAHLNDLPAFAGVNPSTEHLAKYIYTQLAPAVAPLELESVQVWESETASVTYGQ